MSGPVGTDALTRLWNRLNDRPRFAELLLDWGRRGDARQSREAYEFCIETAASAAVLPKATEDAADYEELAGREAADSLVGQIRIPPTYRLPFERCRQQARAERNLLSAEEARQTQTSGWQVPLLSVQQAASFSAALKSVSGDGLP